MNTEEVISAKTKRSRLKAKLSAIKSQLEHGTFNDVQALDVVMSTLNTAYYELYECHELYCEMVSDDQYSTHRVVCGLDLDTYRQKFIESYHVSAKLCNDHKTKIFVKNAQCFLDEVNGVLSSEAAQPGIDFGSVDNYICRGSDIASNLGQFCEVDHEKLTEVYKVLCNLKCMKASILSQAQNDFHVSTPIDSNGDSSPPVASNSASGDAQPVAHSTRIQIADQNTGQGNNLLDSVSSSHSDGSASDTVSNSTAVASSALVSGNSASVIVSSAPVSGNNAHLFTSNAPVFGNSAPVVAGSAPVSVSSAKFPVGSANSASNLPNPVSVGFANGYLVSSTIAQGGDYGTQSNRNVPMASDTSIVSVYNGVNIPPSFQPLPMHNVSNVSNISAISRNHDGFDQYFKKSPPPVFSGKRSEWPEFRVVWNRYASSGFNSDEARAWALKKSLRNEAFECAKPIMASNAGAYQKIWARLEEYYGDVSLNIQSTFYEISKLKPVKEDDLRGLVKFINEVECCYGQLGECGQVNAVTMAQVDEITDKLPFSVRKSWTKEYRGLTTMDKLHPFAPFMMFLESERADVKRLAEREAYKSSSTKSRSSDAVNKKSSQNSSHTFHTEVNSGEHSDDNDSCSDISATVFSCAVHKTDGHNTSKCSDFLKMKRNERYASLKSCHHCFRCLGNHLRKDCKSRDLCKHCNSRNHHTLLCNPNRKSSQTESNTASTKASVESNHASRSVGGTIFPIKDAAVIGSKQSAMLFFDGGSTNTFITEAAVRKFNARPVETASIDITTMGGVKSEEDTWLYELELATQDGSTVLIRAFGMKTLINPVSMLDLKVLKGLFPTFNVDLLQRKSCDIDMLIGGDYSGLHPDGVVARAGEDLLIKGSPFGYVLQGFHPEMRVDPVVSDYIGSHCAVRKGTCSVKSFHTQADVLKFIQGEELGTEVQPKCGGCKCSKCPITGHTFSFHEEQELSMIRSNLSYDPSNKRWITKYPWLIDPRCLPDNFNSALATLRNTEKVLKRDSNWAITYGSQIQDMVDRNVARVLSKEELDSWTGPKFYLSHLAVLNPKSTSTPVRIVFNSSQVYQGHSLNSSLAKGPDSYLNNLLGVILRWREQPVAIAADIRKMYNSIFIEDLEQHCHRFLWRNLEDRQPDVYCIQRVNMGDRPASAISTEAIYMTADLFQSDFPRVAELLRTSTYVDDIVDSVESLRVAETLAVDTEYVLKEAGFKIKSWQFSNEASPRVDPSVIPDSVEAHSTIKVLGISWCPATDSLHYSPTLNFSKKKRGVYSQSNLTCDQIPQAIPDILTRRMVLEQSMKIYDPLGVLSPFTLQSKILLRETWTLKLNWDDQLPGDLRSRWVTFFTQLFQLSDLNYDRCMKPEGAVGNPSLVILSDGSDVAYGFAAYVRWQLQDGSYWCRLALAKCRIAPVHKLTTPQMELNAAVLSKRGRQVLEKELRYQFESVHHLLDSETVLNMLNKVSTRFKLYEGVRVGEIQMATQGNMEEWKWIRGQDNTSDWLTRGKSPANLGCESEWWTGPPFLYGPQHQWGAKSYEDNNLPLPGEKKVKVSSHAAVVESGIDFLDFSKFTSASKAIWVLARVMNAVRSKSFKAGRTVEIKPEVLCQAKEFIVRCIQRSEVPEFEKAKGKYHQLHPVRDDRGLWVVGNRMSRHNPMSNPLCSSPQILLPADHQFTRLLMNDAHVASGHRSRDSILSRFRQEFWTTNGPTMAKAVKKGCQLCRLRSPRFLSPQMGPLPIERLKPAPPFTFVMVDLFGPYPIRGETQKRVTGKGYGIIFTDLVSRAVHIEGAFGYDTGSFLMALSRFTSVRGWPQKLYSDPGSQLVGASNELERVWGKIDKDGLCKSGADKGMEWVFGPADSPWQQGAVESLVKSAKRAIHYAVCDQRMSASEFLTICAQVSNILNERPIGRLPSDDSEVHVLTPNCLLIGRPVAANPGGYEAVSSQCRLKVIDSILDQFWEKWTDLFAPTMALQSKWHRKESRNLQVGDIVVVADSNTLRGRYFLARVCEIFPSSDGQVRKVALEYKSFKVGKVTSEYKVSRVVRIVRSVRRLALLVPVDRIDQLDQIEVDQNRGKPK